MKLALTEFVSLDGVSQSPGSPELDTSGGFTGGGWLVQHMDQEFIDQAAQWLRLALHPYHVTGSPGHATVTGVGDIPSRWPTTAPAASARALACAVVLGERSQCRPTPKSDSAVARSLGWPASSEVCQRRQ